MKFRTISKQYLLILFSILICSCKNRDIIYFYSLDKSQCITVISEYDQRFIINGKYNKLPESNYVKLQLKDRNSMWDGFYVCWKNDEYEWEAVVPYSEVLESKLDTTRFNFATELPKDIREIPTEIKFREGNGAVYDFELKRLTPDEGAILEYE